MSSRKTACILLNYRGVDSVLRLFESLKACDWPEKSIFVVENGSNDGSLEKLRSIFGEDQVVSTPVNLGYAGGMNLGLRHALKTDCEFFWILTKDLTVEPNCLKDLHSLWPRLESPGFLGSLTDLNGGDQVYFFKAEIDRKGRTRHGNKGRTIPEIAELKNEFGETDYVNGACVFTHRSVLEKVGLIPEAYFLYFEDCEWGFLAKKAGFKNYVSYRSRVHHHREVGGFNRTAEYYCRRNAYVFKKRNGFERPWLKLSELLKVQKALVKSWLKRDERLLEVLKAVRSDIVEEKTGLGPWR